MALEKHPGLLTLETLRKSLLSTPKLELATSYKYHQETLAFCLRVSNFFPICTSVHPWIMKLRGTNTQIKGFVGHSVPRPEPYKGCRSAGKGWKKMEEDTGREQIQSKQIELLIESMEQWKIHNARFICQVTVQTTLWSPRGRRCPAIPLSPGTLADCRAEKVQTLRQI